jgi:hypothetical protein
MLSCRPSADGKALLVRVQEALGWKTPAKIALARVSGAENKPITIQARFRPFEIKTIRVERSGRWRETDLLEVSS